MRVMHSLCSAYHWPLREAMKLTLPQIIMLNHAAYVENKESEQRYEQHKKQDEENPEVQEFGGMRLSEITKDEAKLDAYLRDWSGFA